VSESRRAVAAILLGGVLAAACAGTDGSDPASPQIEVFAASSLVDAFTEIGEGFRARHRGASVRFNFLASSDLATQMEQGARADVFASADVRSMARVARAGVLAGRPRVFAHNELAIVVAAGNPHGVDSLEDLEDPDLVVSLCNEECPAGRYALEAFEAARIDVQVDSLEAEVRGVVARVSVGEADAGVVYATDVVSAGDGVEGVRIASSDNVVATYPIAALEGASRHAARFVDFVLSRAGQEIMAAHGFLPA
jgi:molybdate transport system substrate-binding protein